MAKKKKSKKVNIKKIVLSQEDLVRTYNHVSKLRASESTIAWIENRMYELREKSTKAESAVCGCLRSWNITFIYQAPFILDGKIYFADFYIPDKKIVLEIDGKSHESDYQIRYDKERDDSFKQYRMRTVRISNSVALDQKLLRGVLQAENVI